MYPQVANVTIKEMRYCNHLECSFTTLCTVANKSIATMMTKVMSSANGAFRINDTPKAIIINP